MDAVSLGPDDVLIMYLDVGQMPAQKAEEHVEKVRAKLTEVFGDHQKILILPSKDRVTEFGVIHRT